MRSVLFIAIFLLVGNAAYGQCLSYSGRVQLDGVLERKTFPGPPNYESVEAGDAPETAWILKLKQTACVMEGDRNQENIAVPAVTEIQLVMTPDQYREHAAQVGRHITVSGELFHSVTGHHHTEILLDKVELLP
jgi:Domain of unknown function (DUF4431)